MLEFDEVFERGDPAVEVVGAGEAFHGGKVAGDGVDMMVVEPNSGGDGDRTAI